ncbi:hypothetical protein PHMEG_0001943 [Phytophthora megakarya]|uniref:Uncharacterized protein n=1 Tax=Phytophthora megakarya TaxID=4795 RepID=A0A225X1I3_9STRA|nr:hypothetical protein PHMEG_0001943 [Phytophthora megakarya]
MVFFRPGSSILKPGVRERQRELESVITKYELLLTIGQTKNPDFASLDLAQVVFSLAEECYICLIRLLRTAWQIDQSGPASTQIQLDDDATEPDEIVMQTKLYDMLEKTRNLYQLPEVAKKVLAVQGEVQVLLEAGELLTYCKDHVNAMATYSEAIRLCYKIKDEATEAILTSKLRKLQRYTDAIERVEALANEDTSIDDTNAENERNKLKAALKKLGDADGFIVKDQLEALAHELGMDDALSNNEIDEIWRQIQVVDATLQTQDGTATPPLSKISFAALWKWWVSDTVYDFMQSNGLL